MEIWKGKFEYDIGDYGHNRSVEFELHVELKDNSFSGIATDPEFETLCKEPIQVKGFIDGDHISFVKVYPYAYAELLTGELILVESSKEHVVTYDGYFDPDVNKWTGDWELIEKIEKVHVDKDEVFYSIGTWELEIPSVIIP